MLTLMLIIGLGATADCVKTSRNEPTVMVSDGYGKYFVHLLKGEEALCEKYVRAFNSGEAQNICGCKHIRYWRGGKKYNTVRLRCIFTYHGALHEMKLGEYYYYPEMIGACKKTAQIHMNKGM